MLSVWLREQPPIAVLTRDRTLDKTLDRHIQPALLKKPPWIRFKSCSATKPRIGSRSGSSWLLSSLADHCNIATSAAAKRMQLLEADCGVQLLERRARGVKLTAAGEIVARYARGLFDLAFRLGDDLNAFKTGGIGSVRLHVTLSAIAGNELAETLAVFTAEHPRVQVELREDISLRVLRDVVDGQADLVIITSSRRLPSDLDVHPWREDRLVAVMPSSDPLATLPSISFRAVIDRITIIADRG
jgi:DNA-binding transcriptional LysR family regulator